MFVRLLVALSLSSLTASPALAQREDPSRSNGKIFSAFRDVVAKVKNSVVKVHSGGKEVAVGTVVSPDGYIATKNSLLADKIEVKLADGKSHDATVIFVEDNYDLVILKIDARNLPAVKWKAAKDAAVGDWVVTPGTGNDPLAIGVLSVGTRKMSKRDYPPSSNPNSGFLGINLAEGGDGAKVSDVQADTAAAKAGLKIGDVILSVNGKPTPDPETLIATIGGFKPNETVRIKVSRDGKEEEIKATLGKRPGNLSRGDFQNRLGNEMSDRRTGFPAILQHDTVLKPGQCGGPLVDLDGNVLGINIARAGSTESYAIPSENIQAILSDLKSGKLQVIKQPEPKAASDAVKKLEDAVKEATSKVEAATKKAATARKLSAEAKQIADQYGKDNPKLVEVHKGAEEFASKAEQEVASARRALEKAQAELKKAQDAEKE